jgi:hypothetical protein
VVACPHSRDFAELRLHLVTESGADLRVPAEHVRYRQGEREEHAIDDDAGGLVLSGSGSGGRLCLDQITPICTVARQPDLRSRSRAERRIRRSRSGSRQSQSVTELAASGQLLMAASGQISMTVNTAALLMWH